jgi:hypothetical protein
LRFKLVTWNVPTIPDTPAKPATSADRHAGFFLVARRKIFQLKELRVSDPGCSAQNLPNKELICKIFQNKDLAEHFASPKGTFFQTRFRKILIPSELRDTDRRRASQNIVKERLTRKIFRNKDLAEPLCCLRLGA